MRVYTTSSADVGTYNLRLLATVGDYMQRYVGFTFTIIDSCANAVITPTTISATTYQIGTGSMTIHFSNFINSPICAFTYSLFMTTTPSFLTLNSTSQTITVNFNSASDAGIYIIAVKGELSNGLSNIIQFQLTMVNIQTNSPPYFETALTDQQVTVNDTVIYQFPTILDFENNAPYLLQVRLG